jgi:FkbM family methyltransferase
VDPHSALFKLLLFYGCQLPNHPRKWWTHAKLRQLLGPPADVDIDVVRLGLKWSLNPADFEHATLFWTGAKDTWEIRELQARLQPGSVFLDIGANFGYYSIRLATLRPGIEVHAFEPHPVTFRRLRLHIECNGLNPAVHAHELALSDTSGTGRMVGRPDNSGAARLAVGLTGGDGGVEVRTTTLDEFAREASLTRLDCIKIDVEGAEPRVLHGGRETLERFRPALMIEFWTPGLVKAGSTPAELADTLAELGYRMFQPRVRPLARLENPPDSRDPVNVLCLHDDR